MLSFVGKMIKSRIRGRDVASRYKGQRFAILLPKCSIKPAVQKAREILERLGEENFAPDAEDPIRVTGTIGISMFQRGLSREVLIKKAEVAMHFGKDSGRFCAVQYREGSDHEIVTQLVRSE